MTEIANSNFPPFYLATFPRLLLDCSDFSFLIFSYREKIVHDMLHSKFWKTKFHSKIKCFLLLSRSNFRIWPTGTYVSNIFESILYSKKKYNNRIFFFVFLNRVEYEIIGTIYSSRGRFFGKKNTQILSTLLLMFSALWKKFYKISKLHVHRTLNFCRKKLWSFEQKWIL